MTTQAVTRIEVVHGEGVTPASVAAQLAPEAGKPRSMATALANFFAGLAAGMAARVRVAVDSLSEAPALITLAVTQANIAVGEYIDIVIPGFGSFRITAVTSGPDVTLGQFVSETSNAQTATNMAAAINGMLGLKDWVSATTNSGDLIITARREGPAGNSYVVVDGTANGISGEGNFAGGASASSQPTCTITCVFANTDNDDTVSIGGVTMTAKTSGASGNNQFNLGADNAEMTANLLAKLQAHPELLGIMTFTSNSNVITGTFTVPVRVAVHIRLATSDADGLVITQASSLFTTAPTSQQATRSYALGYPDA